MNREESVGQEGIVLRTASTFSGQADLFRVPLENRRGHMANDRHVFSGMILAQAAMILVKRHIEAPVERVFKAFFLDMTPSTSRVGSTITKERGSRRSFLDSNHIVSVVAHTLYARN